MDANSQSPTGHELDLLLPAPSSRLTTTSRHSLSETSTSSVALPFFDANETEPGHESEIDGDQDHERQHACSGHEARLGGPSRASQIALKGIPTLPRALHLLGDLGQVALDDLAMKLRSAARRVLGNGDYPQDRSWTYSTIPVLATNMVCLHGLDVRYSDSSTRPRPTARTRYDKFLTAIWDASRNTSLYILLFLLLLLQTTILVVSDLPFYYSGRRPLDYIYLSVFLAYTIELSCKTVLRCSQQAHSTSYRFCWPCHDIFEVLDLVAIIAFWVMFIIAHSGASWHRGYQVLAALSTLRILRLLNLTEATRSETTVIFTALKESGTKLGKVLSFMCFFWLLFAVIGVQAFQSSLKRSCVPDGAARNSLLPASVDHTQMCSGYLVNTSHQAMTSRSWVRQDGSSSAIAYRRGYLCPAGLICQEDQNPFNGTVSFDNILQSLELVFVIFSANTFSALMYDIIDSEGLIAALFFVSVIIVLYFWLVILLIGIITGAVQRARSDLHRQAKSANPSTFLSFPDKLATPRIDSMDRFQLFLQRFDVLWVLIIACNIVAQCQRSAVMSDQRRHMLELTESIVTWLLLFEIILRLGADRHTFFRSKRNVTDITLVIVTGAMQIPSFRRATRTYPWFTAFQIARSYRVYWSVAPVRKVIMLAFTFFPALIQLCAFFFLLVLLGAISAMHLFKMGHPTNDDPFGGLWTSFLAMYQIFTGEDWTNSLYIITSRDSEHNMAWLGAIFIIGWFIISSILVLNMFIARVDESLSLPDGRRRQIQVINFLHRKRSLIEQNGSAVSGSGAHSGNSPTRDDWPDTSLTKAIDGFLYHEQHRKEAMLAAFPAPIPRTHSRYTTWIFNLRTQFYTTWSNLSASQRYQARSKRLLKSFVHQVYYPIKLGCATLVIPDNDSHLAVANIFTIFIYMSIVAQVVITCITVPMYRRAYFQQHVYTVANWFVWTDLAFVSLWTLEGLLKAIAGGLFRGEHAYLRGWNLIDAIVVATSWLSVLLSLYDFGLLPAQAIIASFKALRILRLLTINKKVMREVTLVFRRGRYKILTCFVVSLTLLVPFALLGLNLFMGQARMCNDSSISNLDTCLGEYASSAAPSVLIPRSVIKPYYSFDNFGESFYTLFLIVSQEGWTDVMYWARGITIGSAAGDTSHSTSNMNALFFVIFNFCGTIFVVALFAAVLIQNYTEATGVAYMTRDQRIWDQKLRMLRRLRPSRRPSAPSQTRTWRRWCYDCATTGKGKWQKGVVALFMLYMSILCIDMYPTKKNISLARDVALVISMIALFSNTLIRLFGLSVQFFFKRPWDCFGFVLLPAGVISSVTHIILPQSTAAHVIKSIAQPAIALLAIPTIGTFRDLLNIAFASIPLVSTLLITWFVLLLFFAIGLTQAFGLTRFGPNETGYVNFRTVPNALILLFRMTLGEGRTKIMEDFASIVPPYCTFGERALESDCGDPTLARVLFITWKMLSIYLFTSLFVSLVFDSFSYVYEALDLKTGPLTQEDLRHFKNAWAVADPRATGYITPASLVRFTNLIEGQLSLRVYPEDFSVLTLRKQCQHLLPLSPGELDLAKLNQRLAEMPVKEIRERRIVMHQYRKEILMKHESNLGISMQAALITLLHYKFAGNNDYLKFEKFYERANQSQQVDEVLCSEMIRGWVKTSRYRREFLKQRGSNDVCT